MNANPKQKHLFFAVPSHSGDLRARHARIHSHHRGVVVSSVPTPIDRRSSPRKGFHAVFYLLHLHDFPFSPEIVSLYYVIMLLYYILFCVLCSVIFILFGILFSPCPSFMLIFFDFPPSLSLRLLSWNTFDKFHLHFFRHFPTFSCFWPFYVSPVSNFLMLHGIKFIAISFLVKFYTPDFSHFLLHISWPFPHHVFPVRRGGALGSAPAPSPPHSSPLSPRASCPPHRSPLRTPVSPLPFYNIVFTKNNRLLKGRGKIEVWSNTHAIFFFLFKTTTSSVPQPNPDFSVAKNVVI